jgi:uncharacterized membrane protein
VPQNGVDGAHSATQSAGVIVVEQSVTTAASADRMWEVLTTHEGMGAWFTPVRKVWLEPVGHPDRNGLGAIRHIKTIGPPVVEEIVEWDPPHRYVYLLLRGAPIRDHRGEVNVEATPAGTRATWKIQFNPVIPLSSLVLKPLMKRVARALLIGAAKHAEALDD